MIWLLLVCGLSACGSKFKTYHGPEVTQVVVSKSNRSMWLMHNEEVLKAYKVDLGRNPVGHKQFEGDGKTPEGMYFINRRNPNSNYHLSIGVSYPNDVDRNNARAVQKSPGGDIFIHGYSDFRGKNKGDWTEGCIAVTNKQMEDIYAMVRDGTPVYISP